MTSSAPAGASFPPSIPPLIPPTITDVILVGGTFDPPHRAHISLPIEARDAARLTGALLLYVPASQSPLKQSTPAASDDDRVAMLKLALESVPNVAIWNDELVRTRGTHERSFTIDTVRRLRECVPRPLNVRLLLGTDQAIVFHRWREPRELLALAPPLVMLRGMTAPEFRSAMSESSFWNGSELQIWERSIAGSARSDISSTRVRDLLSTGASDSPQLAVALAPNVLDFIRRKSLYRG
ncbi:MAG: nicotinate-nicotinamide nucleotide adenylyltransferase [Phycisphaerales bacterium]